MQRNLLLISKKYKFYKKSEISKLYYEKRQNSNELNKSLSSQRIKINR